MAVTINGTTGIETNTDTGKVKVGADDDLVIEHGGTNSVINNTTGHLDFQVGGVKKMRLSDGGDLQLDDSRKIELGTSQDLQIYHTGSDARIDNGTGDLYINAAAGETGIGVYSGGKVELYYANSKKLQTNNTGVEIVGGTDGLQVSHTGGSCIIMSRNSKAFTMNANYAAANTHGAFDISSGMGYKFYIGGSAYIDISSSGTLSGELTDTSDEKRKKNITSIPDGAIASIKQLRPVTFNWKDSDNTDEKSGFIAQEVKSVISNLVVGEEYDESKKESIGYSISTSGVVAHLTKALQEAITKIETLETEVNTLKTKVATLEAA